MKCSFVDMQCFATRCKCKKPVHILFNLRGLYTSKQAAPSRSHFATCFERKHREYKTGGLKLTKDSTMFQ